MCIRDSSETMKFITNAAYQASAVIGGEKGSSPIFNEENYMKCPFVQEALSKETQLQITENGLRNIAIMSIAPTGSISNIVLSLKHLLLQVFLDQAETSHSKSH